MAISKLKSGKYQVRISTRNSDGSFSSHKKSFKLKRDAEAYYRGYKDKKDEFAFNSMTYREIFEESIKAVESTILPRSIQEKRTNAETYWGELFDKPYNSITKKDWLDIWIKINNADRSYATKNKAVKYLKSVTRFAYRFLDLPDNAKHLQTFKATSDDIEDMVTWTQDEFNTFIDYVDNYTYKALFCFYYDTGITLSEALAIVKDEIVGNVVSVNFLMETKTKRTRLKNKYRRRKVYLAPKTLRMIEPLLKSEGDYVFGGVEALSNRTVPREMDKYINLVNENLKKQGLKQIHRITPHGFRHSHATNLINNGVNIVAVSRRLGHSNIQTTLNTYTHLLRGKDNQIIEIIENL